MLTEIEEQLLIRGFGMALERWHVTQLLRAHLDLELKTSFGIRIVKLAIEDRLCILSGYGWALMFLLAVIFDMVFDQRRSKPLQRLLFFAMMVVRVAHLDLGDI